MKACLLSLALVCSALPAIAQEKLSFSSRREVGDVYGPYVLDKILNASPGNIELRLKPPPRPMMQNSNDVASFWRVVLHGVGSVSSRWMFVESANRKVAKEGLTKLLDGDRRFYIEVEYRASGFDLIYADCRLDSFDGPSLRFEMIRHGFAEVGMPDFRFFPANKRQILKQTMEAEKLAIIWGFGAWAPKTTAETKNPAFYDVYRMLKEPRSASYWSPASIHLPQPE